MKRLLLILLLTAGLLSLPVAVQADDDEDDFENVLIRTTKPYANLVSSIEALGGKVTYQYKYMDAIAAEVPRGALAIIRSLVGPNAITKDDIVPNPTPVDTLHGKNLPNPRTGDERRISSESVEGIAAADLPAFAAANPNAYLINNSIMNADVLHAAGITGAGVIVGVIDSGIRPGFPHIDLDGSVIGCEDFVGDGLGCSNPANGGHGTFVAGMISANVVFTLSAGFTAAIQAYCPSCFLDPPTNSLVPMIGSAPLSSIYAFRVFAPVGGSPSSRILAAIDRVIELRDLFDAGDPAGTNIQVVNMSLGGATLFAGRDLFDTAVNVMLEKDIVLVVSAGNAGPSSLTVGSPGSSFGAITVGAASHAHNERILRDLQFGLGAGSLFRPFDGTQTAFFSSRGPNADGRIDPDVTASGFASFGQGFFTIPTSITIGSGTSFSAPGVSGVAALMLQAFPGATARQVRNAIIASANPTIITDGSTELDQGNGFVDALAASNRLAAGGVPDSLPELEEFDHEVIENLEDVPFLLNNDDDCEDDVVREHARDLKPGERADVLFCVQPKTKQVLVTLFNVTPALPPSQQNVFFGDDILLAIHSAKTSTADDLVFEFTSGGTFVIDDPEPGLLRVTLNGDWTNAGTISADVTIFSTPQPLPGVTARGRIADGQTLVFPIGVPASVSEAEFRLSWRGDWSRYPTSDIDLILVDPNFAFNFDGATLNSPEVTVVDNPLAGTWFAVLDGFEIHTPTDSFKLRVSLDGRVVRIAGGDDDEDDEDDE